MVRVLVAALVMGMLGTAAADTESARLFEEGRALAKDSKWDEACAKFAKSLELDRAPGTLLNYADCHEHLGHLAQAWRLYDEAAQASEKEGNADRAKFARERAQALVPKTSTIVVKLATPDEPGITVNVAGRKATLGGEIREIVDPGEVTIEVSAPNKQSFTKTERAEAGLRIVVDVPKLADGPHEDLGVRGERRKSRVYVAYTMAGGGVAALVAGVLVGINAKNKYNGQFETMPPNCTKVPGDSPMCNPEGYTVQSNAITQANIGTVLGVAGVLLIGGGAVVYLTAPRDTVVIPTATASSAGLAVVGRF